MNHEFQIQEQATMKCSTAEQQIIEFIYGELPDQDSLALDRHLAACERCRRELASAQAMRRALPLDHVQEPSPSFLAASRIRLDDALDQLPPATLRQRLEIGAFGFLAQLRAAPGMAMALAVVGVALGSSAGHYWNGRFAAPAPPPSQAAPTIADAAAPPSVLGVSSIVQHPNTSMVEVHFNQSVPATVEGSIDDPEVRKLLLMATGSSAAPAVKNNSVGLLASQCKAGRLCDQSAVRTALMVALRYNRDPGIRLTALEGLEPYIAQDMRVRDAVLESLMHDPYAPIRSRALAMLEPVEADSSVRMVLHTVSTEDGSPAMRQASMKALAAFPPIE